MEGFCANKKLVFLHSRVTVSAPCDSGEYLNGEECAPCKAGSSQGNESFTGDDCTPCSPGHYAAQDGASECTPCQKGASVNMMHHVLPELFL